MGRPFANVYRLGVKELWSLARDPMLLIFIVIAFTAMIYSSATARPETLHLAPIAVIDHDVSPLSQRIVDAFYPPHFLTPRRVTPAEANAGMDAGEHLLVMPVTPAEIMIAKVWSMGLVVLVAAAFSLLAIVRGALHVPIGGSVALFLAGAALHLFATTSMGIFMATLARSMPQFGMLLVLVMLPLQMLSGGNTPRESMPRFVQELMLAAPTTHFVQLSQAILFRGAGLAVVWPAFVWLAGIGCALFALSLVRFRKTLSQMG